MQEPSMHKTTRQWRECKVTPIATSVLISGCSAELVKSNEMVSYLLGTKYARSSCRSMPAIPPVLWRWVGRI